MKALWETVALPVCRAEPHIDGFDIRQRHGVARMQQKRRVLGYRLFRVKAHGPAGFAVIIFEKADDRDIGPYLFEKRQLPPPHVAHDNIRLEPFAAFDLLGGTGSAQTVARGFLPVL